MKHLTPKVLAERLGITERTLCNWRNSGTGPKFLTFPAGVGYREADIEEWEENALCRTTLQALVKRG